MPNITVEAKVLVTLTIPKDKAGKVTDDDLREMVGNAVSANESSRGVQLILNDGVAEWESDEAYERSCKTGDMSGAVIVDVFNELDEMEVYEADEAFTGVEQ